MPINLVVIATSDSATHGLRKIAQGNRWCIHPCATLVEAMLAVSRLSNCVVLCDSRIGNTTWRDVLKYLNSRGTRTPLIVFTQLDDVHLWLDVLDAGGHDLVLFPFEERELVHVLRSACRTLKASGATA